MKAHTTSLQLASFLNACLGEKSGVMRELIKYSQSTSTAVHLTMLKVTSISIGVAKQSKTPLFESYCAGGRNKPWTYTGRTELHKSNGSSQCSPNKSPESPAPNKSSPDDQLRRKSRSGVPGSTNT